MRVLVLGGTGAIGKLLVQEALAAKHVVVVYARSPQKLPESITSHRDVVIVKGELQDEEALAKAMEGVHAVLSALGPSVWHPRGMPVAKGYKTVLKVMHAHGVKRLIALGTPSIRDPLDRFSPMYASMVAVIATLAHSAYRDIVAVGDVIRADEELVWTIPRVPILTNSDNREVVAGYAGDAKMGPTVARVAFAAFVVQELERNAWARKAPIICSA
ncbi:NAD(P)-binding protein [Dentipellis sp. KUC8613]|nr:NAD(P)-binding protein [Dentipellis sp. KUC8613]